MMAEAVSAGRFTVIRPDRSCRDRSL